MCAAVPMNLHCHKQISKSKAFLTQQMLGVVCPCCHMLLLKLQAMALTGTQRCVPLMHIAQRCMHLSRKATSNNSLTSMQMVFHCCHTDRRSPACFGKPTTFTSMNCSTWKCLASQERPPSPSIAAVLPHTSSGFPVWNECPLSS